MSLVWKLLVVGLGGFAGAILRYLVGGWVQGAFSRPWPFGTFAVNIAGCFAIGLVWGLVENRDLFNPAIRLFILTGVLGGFTTFSTFSLETYNLVRQGDWLGAGLNAGLSVFLGLLAAALAYHLSDPRIV